MTRIHIQMAGLFLLSALAGVLLYLIGYTFSQAVSHVTPDGKVPLADAGMFTAFLLSFQQTVGAIRSIWESQERTALAESGTNGPASRTAQEGAQRTADAAQNQADQISETQ